MNKIKRGIKNINPPNKLVGRKILRVGNAKIAIIVAVLIVGLIGARIVWGSVNSQAKSSNNQKELTVKKPISVATIEKEYNFPLNDSAGSQVSDLKYEIVSAELRDEIIVNGKRRAAVNGNLYLLINLKITNDYNRTIDIRSRDYIRLTMDGNEEERLAPDIHNDPVKVQAISTKQTRVAFFPISKESKDFVLHVGEIEGDKERLPLEFNK